MAKQTRAKVPTGNSTDGEETEKKTSPAALATDIEPETGIHADQMPSGDSAAGDGNDPMVATVEAAITPEFEMLEELGKEEFEFLEELGKEGLEVTEMATMSLADGFCQLASESSCYTKELLDRGYAFAGELRQAKSPIAAAQVQIDFARSNYLRLLDHFLRLGTASWDLLCLTCKPVKRQVAKVKC